MCKYPSPPPLEPTGRNGIAAIDNSASTLPVCPTNVTGPVFRNRQSTHVDDDSGASERATIRTLIATMTVPDERLAQQQKLPADALRHPVEILEGYLVATYLSLQ